MRTRNRRLSWDSLTSPVGELTVVANDVGLLRVAFASPQDVLPEFSDHPLREKAGMARSAAVELGEYFAGHRRRFDIPVEWPPTGGLRSHVLRTLHEKVPFGETVSYRELAEMSGRPDAARAVGSTMGSNPIPLVVPCHRVLASGGGLGGFGPGLPAKRRLLVLEGVLEPTLLDLDVLPS